MPCDTIQTSKVEFGKNTDSGLLAQAMMAMGYRNVTIDSEGNISANYARFNKASGELTIRQSFDDGGQHVAALKRDTRSRLSSASRPSSAGKWLQRARQEAVQRVRI